MKKMIILLALVCLSLITHAQQGSNTAFSKFAQENNERINDAYDNKDAKACEKEVKDLQAKYSALTAKEQAEYKSAISNAYYNLACVYAITGDKKHAMDALERSEDYDYAHLLDDNDLDGLRKEPRFIKYLAKAKTIHPDHITELKNAATYGSKSSSGIPAFKYQQANNEHLALLRKTYNLDSVAGHGSDVSQMINLMRWVHNLIPHNGNGENPEVKNALDFITVCKRDKKTLNCRGLGILLNEVYLAEGFKSRYVTCKPKDTADGDCHVITMVYSVRLNKWIWMDPTFNAYVMDENGNLLGLEEVRSRLISNKPLILNPDADHNHENSETKKYYLGFYMAKNLYKLECPVSSEYNYETADQNNGRAYIELIPGTQAPPSDVTKNSHGVARFTTYYTTDKALFWKTPMEEAKADYEATMSKFQKNYNAHNVEEVDDLYSDEWGKKKKELWTEKVHKDMEEQYGKLKAYKFIGVDEDGTFLYKVTYEKSTHAMGILLDHDGKFLNFRPKTSSTYINSLLAKG